MTEGRKKRGRVLKSQLSRESKSRKLSNETQLKTYFTDVNKRTRNRFLQQKLAVHCA